MHNLLHAALRDKQSCIMQRFAFSAGVADRGADDAGDTVAMAGNFGCRSLASVYESGGAQEVLGRVTADSQFSKHDEVGTPLLCGKDSVYDGCGIPFEMADVVVELG